MGNIESVDDKYSDALDILVQLLDTNGIETGLPKNSRGTGGYSISSETTKLLAEILTRREERIKVKAQIEAASYIINNKVCMLHAAQGKVGDGISCICKPNLDTGDIVRFITDLEQQLKTLDGQEVQS